ncbi:glycine betaine ABC transporter substrate-binding protein [Iamia majanohamensis]|uniref:Glycine betaine ABC transporter substrate-binding protein n=1 Tax=Iamia majanohamensis TaxID=467976 RepID=A0AAE9Y6J0_9ACTN|nr:glycine betaine ABC transporter substrate-binding protein [Iamia majanohamensis]WCO67482.1 glycine betaine ABC transporter substrate-binding protein [Iamia majanohamensis]
MHTRHPRFRLLLVPLAVLALLASACGGDDDGGDSETAPAETVAPEEADAIDLDGVSLTVGSKDFDESILLGQMMVIAAGEKGADVTDSTNTGGTNVARQALESGEIGVYPEYNGTGWTEHLGNEDPSSDPEELYTMVAEQDLETNNIHWLGSSEFNNTYGFATGPDLTEENGEPFSFETMATYLEENPDATVCMETEFPDRSDGLVLWEDETGYEIPQDQIEILDTNIIYTETANGNCDFGEIFTTDGRIEGLDLTIVEDPGAMIIYNVSYTFTDEAYQQNPEGLTELSEAILGGLSQEKMNELNKQVSFDGEDPADVATGYLEEIGLITG